MLLDLQGRNPRGGLPSPNLLGRRVLRVLDPTLVWRTPCKSKRMLSNQQDRLLWRALPFANEQRKRRHRPYSLGRLLSLEEVG